MPTTLEILAGHTNANSRVREIEVRRTRTEYCPNHWFIVFRHPNGDNTSAKAVKRLDVVEWTWGVEQHPSDFMKFDVTDICPGVQDLATCIFVQESHGGLQISGLCCCFQWVYLVIRDYQRRGYLPKDDHILKQLRQFMSGPDT